MSTIKFGTDGWRDIIADKFTFANVRIVAQGMASFINNHQLAKRGVVIGYDNRFLSDEFAWAIANVMAGNGIKVFMPDKAYPTPVVAYAVRAYNAAGAVMVTASHNPANYNGMKFIPEYAGPALPDITDQIEKEIARVTENGKIYELSKEEATKLGLILNLEIEDKYIKQLQQVVNLDKFKDNPLKVVVDPMYGAGIGYLEKALGAAGCQVTVLHGHRDPLFGGGMPEPTDQILGELKSAVIENGAALGLALDGDADRFGIVDDQGKFLTPNQILFLLLRHLLSTRTFRGPVARTLATTHMLDRVAAASGLGIIETPVGFKYIGECMREKGCILGGEESGGLTILGHVPEKDGILAGLLVAEMVADSKKKLSDILIDFEAQFGHIESQRLDIHYNIKDKERVMALMKEYRPRHVAGQEVDSVSELEGKKVRLDDGSWFLIRASGTEPLFRLYVEAGSIGMVQAIQHEVKEALGLK
ncbi:MAG: phosphoglucomutase/phosphomannomutase family protein [Ignavibacteriales bacterium]